MYCSRAAKKLICSPGRMLATSPVPNLKALKPKSRRSNEEKPRKESRLRLKIFADPPPPYPHPRILPPPLLHRRRSPRTGVPIWSRCPHHTNSAELDLDDTGLTLRLQGWNSDPDGKRASTSGLLRRLRRAQTRRCRRRHRHRSQPPAAKSVLFSATPNHFVSFR
jgi:hypothetical protein